MTTASAINMLIAFVATCLLVELTPGPNMAYLAILSIGTGRRAGMAATFGTAAGLSIVGLASVAGIAAIIANSRVLFELLRWLGAAYLLWLAWEGWHDEGDTSSAAARSQRGDTPYFIRGFLTNVLNPKAALFYTAIIPTFIDPNLPLVRQSLMLVAIYVAVATVIHSLIVLFAGLAQPRIADEHGNKRLRRAFSLALVAVAVWLFANAKIA